MVRLILLLSATLLHFTPPSRAQEAIFPPWYTGEMNVLLGETGFRYQGKLSLDPAQPLHLGAALARISGDLTGVVCAPRGLVLLHLDAAKNAAAPWNQWPQGFTAAGPGAEIALPDLQVEVLVAAGRVDLDWPSELPLAQRYLAVNTWLSQQPKAPNTTAQWQLAADGQTFSWQTVRTLGDVRLAWYAPQDGWALLRLYEASGQPCATPCFSPLATAVTATPKSLLAWGFPQTTRWRQPSTALALDQAVATHGAKAALAEAQRRALTLEAELRGVLKTRGQEADYLAAWSQLQALYQEWRPWWLAHQAYRALLNAPSGWFRYSEQLIRRTKPRISPAIGPDSTDARYLAAYFAAMPAPLLPAAAQEVVQNYQKNYAQLIQELLIAGPAGPQANAAEWAYFFGALFQQEENLILPNYRSIETQIEEARFGYFRALNLAFPERNFAPNADGTLRGALARLAGGELAIVGMATANQAALFDEKGQLMGFAGGLPAQERDLATIEHQPQPHIHPWHSVANALAALGQSAAGQIWLREINGR